MRVSNRIPVNFTPEYIGHLKCRDFLGELTPEEVDAAKKCGVYKWNEIVKGWHERRA